MQTSAGCYGRASLDDSTSLELVETDFFGLYSVMTTVTLFTVTWVKRGVKLKGFNPDLTFIMWDLLDVPTVDVTSVLIPTHVSIIGKSFFYLYLH